MTEQTTETEAPAKKAKKVRDKTPCLCSLLRAHSEVVQPENGGSGEPEIELTTGCPGVLTSKTFAPGHDAKAVGFLLDVLKNPELELWFGIVGSDPDTTAKKLGDALYAKFLTGKANIEKKEAARYVRDQERAARRAEAEQAKAAKTEATAQNDAE